ncbi:MAG TPA: type II toxin-antitoxin system HicA family toxin [Chitinophagales bacterium]|jgi:predicted RNA binding protein YcfA (HicA-like mRNA interferase family)|nr:type II toxin-antitoxin system HicA family toxin [Chitinophagales bacterium]HPN18750.1 type II toxin-antitoxin system HicA family toxin [Chitinophagales bacterium]
MVKYKDFIKHLKVNGCTLLRQGNKHEIWEKDGKQSSVPRHPNINKLTCWAICKQLGIPKYPIK